MKPFKKTRLVEIEVVPGKSVTIEINVRGEKDGQLTIFTKIGEELTNGRVTSIYNPNIVKEMKK